MKYVGLVNYQGQILHIEDLNTRSPRLFDTEEEANAVSSVFGLPTKVLPEDQYIKKSEVSANTAS